MKVKQQRVRANALVVTLVTIAVVAGLVGLSVDLTRGVGRNVQRSTLLRQATNIGDAATEMAFADWRAICIQNSLVAAPAGKYFDTNVELPSPSPGNFPGVPSYTLKKFSVVPLDSTWTPIADMNAAPSKTMGSNPQNYSYYYLASADVVIPTMTSTNPTDDTDGKNVVARVRRVLEKYRHNKTDKAIDYKDDLEIHPGPTFVVNGDVHTNGNLYTAHSQLTLSGTTTFTGNWAVDFMPGDGQHNGEIPSMPSWGTGRPPLQDQAEVPYGVSAPDYHKLIESTVASSDPLYPYAFSNSANYDVKITIDASNVIKVYNSSGSDITNSGTGTTYKNAVTTNQSITDKRQASASGNGTIRIATLDIGAIKSISNGYVIYISDTSGTTNQRGIRLKNGASLPSQGLTVASSNPVYIQGDYNTGTNGSTQPPSNTTSFPFSSTSPPSSTVSGYAAAPSAVIADAVTILSNSWSDSNSNGNLNSRKASNTTVNTAIVAGIVPTGNGYYSGGAENFPRFIENWDTKTLTYYGSMIELYSSTQATGHWGAADVYSPPNRAWYFDTGFLSNPPPGIPYDWDYRRSRWSME